MKRIALFLFVFVLSLFLSVGKLFAEDIGNNIINNIENYSENNIQDYTENNIDNNLDDNSSQELELITTDTNISNEKPMPSIKDIFGDDQTFPFVAGFGKD